MPMYLFEQLVNVNKKNMVCGFDKTLFSMKNKFRLKPKRTKNCLRETNNHSTTIGNN